MYLLPVKNKQTVEGRKVGVLKSGKLTQRRKYACQWMFAQLSLLETGLVWWELGSPGIRFNRMASEESAEEVTQQAREIWLTWG